MSNEILSSGYRWLELHVDEVVPIISNLVLYYKTKQKY